MERSSRHSRVQRLYPALGFFCFPFGVLSRWTSSLQGLPPNYHVWFFNLLDQSIHGLGLVLGLQKGGEKLKPRNGFLTLLNQGFQSLPCFSASLTPLFSLSLNLVFLSFLYPSKFSLLSFLSHFPTDFLSNFCQGKAKMGA